MYNLICTTSCNGGIAWWINILTDDMTKYWQIVHLYLYMKRKRCIYIDCYINVYMSISISIYLSIDRSIIYLFNLPEQNWEGVNFEWKNCNENTLKLEYFTLNTSQSAYDPSRKKTKVLLKISHREYIFDLQSTWKVREEVWEWR